MPFALFALVLGVWTYEVLAENPVPDSVMRLIPTGWRFWLAKGLHVAAYAVLTLLAAWLPIPRALFWLVIAGLLLHGVGTEFGQTFTANRSGSLRDVVLDWVGVAAGLLTLAVFGGLRRAPARPEYT
jgi:VanZ family protein